MIEGLKQKVDLKYKSYIKENTGYEVDIFEAERQRVEKVQVKGKIDTEEESRDVSLMLRVFEIASDASEKVKSLTSLLRDFYESKTDAPLQKRRKVKSEIIQTVEEDGVVKETIRITFGTKPVHFKEREEIAPDGKRRLTVTEWSDGKYPSTSVAIFFDKASGPVYGTNGVYPDVNAFWKDNNTIVIETKKSYIKGVQHRKMQSFDDIIFVEYIET